MVNCVSYSSMLLEDDNIFLLPVIPLVHRADLHELALKIPSWLMMCVGVTMISHSIVIDYCYNNVIGHTSIYMNRIQLTRLKSRAYYRMARGKIKTMLIREPY